MEWWMILIIIVIVILFVFILIWRLTENSRKSKRASERFENDKFVQNSNISSLVETGKAWIPSDIIRGQGNKKIDAASSKSGDSIDGTAGICAFYVSGEDFSSSDFFVPIYVGKTTNFRRRWMQHIKRINDASYYKNIGTKKSEIKYAKISNYLHYKKLTPNDLRFVVLKTIPRSQYEYSSKELEAKYIQQTGAGQRGFNSVNA